VVNVADVSIIPVTALLRSPANICRHGLQAASAESPQADDVLAILADERQIRRVEAFSLLSILVVPPDALLQMLLGDSRAACQRNSTGVTLQQEALVAAAAIFGAEGEFVHRQVYDADPFEA
jgi:hypothetical protein